MPDKTHEAAKALAVAQESSLAEIIRRALEDYLTRYPGKPDKEWTLPPGRPLGLREDIDWSKVKDDLYERDPFKSIRDQ